MNSWQLGPKTTRTKTTRTTDKTTRTTSLRQLGPLLEDNSDHFWGQLGPIFRVKSDHFYVSYNHFLKTTWTTFLGQLGPILMAIHPVLLNANWYSHRQKLTISFKNCLSETRFYSIILIFSSNFKKLLHVYIEKKHISFFFNFIIPLIFTLKTSKYCDRGKKDQHNIQQYIHSKPNKQNRVHVIV